MQTERFKLGSKVILAGFFVATIAVGSYNIPDGGVTTTKYANNSIPTTAYGSASVTSGKIASATILGSNVASGTISGTNIVTDVNLPGDLVKENGRNVVVSSANAASSLNVLRGYIDAAGAITSGEGFTVSHPGTGHFTITITSAMADIPAVVCGNVNFDTSCNAYNLATTGFDVQNKQSGVNADVPFTIIAIGRR